MKKLTTIIAFFVFYSASAQKFSISADKNNVLWIGVDNPLTIAVENYPSNQIVVKADKGEIIGGYGNKYIYRGSEPDGISIILYKKSNLKEIGRWSFRLKHIPDPVPKVGPSGGGDIQRIVLINQQYIRADIENFDFNAMFGIDSFTLNVIRTDTCFFKEIINIGSKFGNAVSEALSSIKKNDIVIFKKIYAKGPDGRSRLLSPLVFTIIEP